MLKTRIIPVLLMKNRGLYKGIKFKRHSYVGDPINTVKIFNEKEVDELIIFDIEASLKNKPIDFEYLKDVISEAFMPIGYGGGISSLDDAKRLFSIGIEKVILNTIAFKNPNIIRELSKNFGSQAIVISIDVRNLYFGNSVYIKSGTEKIKYNLLQAALIAEKYGAGEVIINDIDKDGTRSKYRIEYIKEISNKIKIPLIICGGASSIDDFINAKKAGANGCAAGAMFVYQGPLRAVLISYPKYDDLRRALGE